MAVDLSNILVVGVSSRALFAMENENTLFDQKGVEAFKQHQLKNEKKILGKGSAFHLVEQLLSLNDQGGVQLVEVVIMSRNSPETGIRVMNSIKSYGLKITRMAYSGGEDVSPYIKAYSVDLFLSKDLKDVQAVIDSKTSAAALILNPPTVFDHKDETVRIAFDADAVLFSDKSEQIYKKDGLEKFMLNESEHELVPLEDGPFANLLRKLSSVQKLLEKIEKRELLRLAIVTARSAPAHTRILNTLRHWGVSIDEIHFLGGLAKDEVLEAYGAHIFFDDQDCHLDSASKVVPSGKVPYSSNSPLSNK